MVDTGAEGHPIDQLALSLANNYICSNLGLTARARDLLKTAPSGQNYRRRVVVVVGAGASQDAGLPGTQETIAKLTSSNFLPDNVIEEELDRLVAVQRLDRSQFETQVLAMSATEHSGALVRKKLADLFRRRYMPTQPYEILAHLLKHRFIDAIVSFNFDELLDQAISDELYEEEYNRIISDGDCPPAPLPSNKPLEKPLYIKPHGTVGHPSTMRFTREDYYRLPYEIRRILSELFCSTLENGERRPVDLISIGFGMMSYEFNEILTEAGRHSRIFYINLQQPEPDPAIGDTFKPYFVKVDDNAHTLSRVMSELWSETRSHFKDEYKPRDTHRHHLLSELFVGERRQPTDNDYYLWDRTVIELCLAIAKGCGFVMRSQLSASRCGIYYGLYRDETTRPPRSFTELCKFMGLKDAAYGFEALQFIGPDSRTQNVSAKVLEKEGFEKKLDWLLDKTRKKLTPRRKAAFDSQRELLRQTMQAHFDGGDVEVRYRPPNSHRFVFHDPTEVRSMVALRYRTTKILKEPGWRYLCVVSETGQWLLKDEVSEAIKKCKPKGIYVIVADDTHRKRLENRYPSRIVVKVLNWWDHNRHLTLLLDSDCREIASLYFSRQRRTNDIIPVQLNANDSKIISEYFKAYWIRAERGANFWVSREEISAFDCPRIQEIEKKRKNRATSKKPLKRTAQTALQPGKSKQA